MVQTAMGLMLVVDAALLMRSLANLRGVDVGFDTRSLYDLTLRLDDPQEEGGPETNSSTHDALLPALGAVPGIHYVSLTTGAPFTSGGWTVYVEPEGIEMTDEDLQSARIGLHQVSGGHLSSMGVSILSGREILDTDGAGGDPVVVISSTLAEAYWPSGNALGQRLVVGGDATFTPRTVVGVVEAPRYAGPGLDPGQHIYLPYRQFIPGSVDLMFRAGNVDAATIAAVRASVHRVAPDASVRRLSSVDDLKDGYFVEPSFYAWLLSGYAMVALLLAALGLYGSLAFAASRQRRELGIHAALGAERSVLVSAFVVRGLGVTSLGVAAGLVCAAATGSLLRGFLFGVSSGDPPMYALGSSILLAVGLVASWIPAHDAARVDPVECLRAE